MLPNAKGKGPAVSGSKSGLSFAARRKAALMKKKGPSLAEKRKAMMAVPDMSVENVATSSCFPPIFASIPFHPLQSTSMCNPPTFS